MATNCLIASKSSVLLCTTANMFFRHQASLNFLYLLKKIYSPLFMKYAGNMKTISPRLYLSFIHIPIANNTMDLTTVTLNSRLLNELTKWIWVLFQFYMGDITHLSQRINMKFLKRDTHATIFTFQKYINNKIFFSSQMVPIQSDWFCIQ